jgi:hypothetical protein
MVNVNESDYLGDLDLDGRVIIIWFFKKQDVTRQFGYTCAVLIENSGRLLGIS